MEALKSSLAAHSSEKLDGCQPWSSVVSAGRFQTADVEVKFGHTREKSVPLTRFDAVGHSKTSDTGNEMVWFLPKIRRVESCHGRATKKKFISVCNMIIPKRTIADNDPLPTFI